MGRRPMRGGDAEEGAALGFAAQMPSYGLVLRPSTTERIRRSVWLSESGTRESVRREAFPVAQRVVESFAQFQGPR